MRLTFCYNRLSRRDIVQRETVRVRDCPRVILSVIVLMFLYDHFLTHSRSFFAVRKNAFLIVGLTYGCTDGQTNGQTDGQTEGQMRRRI